MLRDRLDVVHTSRLVHTAFGRLQYLNSSGVVLSRAGRDPVHFALSSSMTMITSIMQWIMVPMARVSPGGYTLAKKMYADVFCYSR